MKLFYGNSIYVTNLHFVEYSAEYQCLVFWADTPPQLVQDWGAPDITMTLYIGKDFTSLCFHSDQLFDDALWQTLFDAQNGIINPLFYIIDSKETEDAKKVVDNQLELC